MVSLAETRNKKTRSSSAFVLNVRRPCYVTSFDTISLLSSFSSQKSITRCYVCVLSPFSDTPAFRVSIRDSDGNSWDSPCYAWGAPALDISSIIDAGLFSKGTVTVDSVTDLGNDQFKIESTSFVEGVLLIQDYINPGNRCPGHVLSIGDNGKSVAIQSLACATLPGDVIFVGSDVTIIESFTDNGGSISELTVVSLFADAEIAESVDGLYKLSVEFEGVSKSTSCLPYHASALTIQQEIGLLFDYNKDGLIDASDVDHISVSRTGDGSSSSGYGYLYEFLSNGSSSSIGSSAVLGSNAPKFSILDIGADGGCDDYGTNSLLITSTASTTDESNSILLGPDATIAIKPGAKLRASSSMVPSKVYVVDHISEDGNTLILTETFDGSTTTGTTALHLISGGSPQFSVEIVREGVSEYVYDMHFVGSHWADAPEITVNTFGDGVCAISASDIDGGMNRNIGIQTINDGGSNPVSAHYVLHRVPGFDLSGKHDLFVVPPVFTVHPDSSEVQRIIVMDNDNTSIWASGQPTFKLSNGGDHTGCLPHNAVDLDIENALNSLTSLCPGPDRCVTVTRHEDSVLAPNGHVYHLYFDSSLGDVPLLGADASHVDCSAFDDAGGEKVVMDTLSQGKSAAKFSKLQVPFDGSPVDRWLGEPVSNLPIYRVSGTFWFIRFEQSLGNVVVSLDSSALSSNAQQLNFFNGVNQDRIIIPGLSTGIKYFTRVYSRTSLGFSPPSNIANAIPSDKPEKLTNVSSGHALHKNEVQAVTIAASHRKEVQAVTTSAVPLSEVQEITIEGTESSDADTYLFSLRHPEIQIVKWSSGSPVTAGSFFLKLLYADKANSIISGSVTYKEMKTPCMNFDATADDVKHAMETDAINALGENSVQVTRSGNRSFSSDYGYSYEIRFVGSNVRGNVPELTSDLALTGMDSSGGNSCIAFVSSTNDSSLEVRTENESRALGTDTPRAEIIVDTNMAIVDGEFQLSVTHFGRQLTTGCIPWDGTAEQVKFALESLDIVDSVRVDRTGDGVLSDNGGHFLVDDYSFQHTTGSSFLASSSDGLSDVLFAGDIVKLSTQADSSVFYEVVSLSSGTMVLDKPFDGDTSMSSYVTRYFSYKFDVYFDGTAMHTDGGQPGFMPLQGSNFVVTEPNGCKPLQAYHNNVLKDMIEIPDSIANVRAVSKYDGEHTLIGTPTGASSQIISNALTLSLPMSITEARVASSLEIGENGLTFSLSFGQNDGNIPLFVCNHSPASLFSCGTSTVMDGNELGGSFYLFAGSLWSTGPIAFNASPSDVESALSGVGRR